MDPEKRLTAMQILERIAAISESNGYNLKAPLDIKAKPTVSALNDLLSSDLSNANGIKMTPPTRPAQPSPAHNISRPPPPTVRFLFI